MGKLVIFDGRGTIWYSMKVLYEHYKMAALYFGLIKELKDFPYSFVQMNELSSLREFNSRANIGKALAILLKREISFEELEDVLENSLNLKELAEKIGDMIKDPDTSEKELGENLGKFLQDALYNYNPGFYPIGLGVYEALTLLKNSKKDYTIALLSNRWKDSAVGILEVHNLCNFFDCIFAPENKNEPLQKDFSQISNKTNIPQENSIFIGDSLMDILSAREFDFKRKVIATLSGMGTRRMFSKLPEKDKPDFCINNLVELKFFL